MVRSIVVVASVMLVTLGAVVAAESNVSLQVGKLTNTAYF